LHPAPLADKHCFDYYGKGKYMKILPADLPGVNRLYMDYLRDFRRVAPFYRMDYASDKSVLQQIDILHDRRYPRIELGRALDKQNQAFGAGKATMKNLEDLALGNANVIITGQQVGLFGGPFFVLYKALTAIKLADRLSRICNDCFVPVFWLATDDSDFVEVNHTTILSRDYQNLRLELPVPDAAAVPVGQRRLGDEIEALLQQLAEVTPETEFKDEILQGLREAYRPDHSLGQAFGRWLMHLLGDFGLILVDPSDPELRQLAAPIFEKEIRDASPSTQAVLDASQKLEAAGYTPGVRLRPGFLNLFYVDNERHALEFKNGRIRSTDGRFDFSRDELLGLLAEHPERFSPNVALRAPMQDFIFPTVAYVAGPAEIAYFGQLKGVYALYDIPMPLIYPRKSATLIEPGIDRILDKYHLHLRDIWGDIEQRISQVTRQNLPEALLQQLQDFRQHWPQELLQLREEIIRIDPTLERMTASTAARVAGAVEHLEKKIVQAGKRQNDIVAKQLRKAAAALYPEHTLQERKHSYVPYLMKYSRTFIERLYEVMDIAGFCHQIIRI